ncbi:hypothetical protein JCM6292_1120 [Bacteroides pyogenes JCM 6292]|uniref:Uncharacterized protein n=2 Tax=Bacteroides pyogenes TaxID=310300 RepID=W4PHL9_9BACE|nr:hypothetical protein JCM6292_1120 [Bacteroides pyogenes JCM 6292]GAE18644.1 hypothetical protein JCM6294_1571 [Bacteroides pyogenes DSM 20611 = JCM 6294]
MHSQAAGAWIPGIAAVSPADGELYPQAAGAWIAGIAARQPRKPVPKEHSL